MPTDYGNVNYWDQRFAQKHEAFEWLKSCEDFMPYVEAAADTKPQGERLILHIGPGSSNLSLELRRLVLSPLQIHNVDFSIEAVQLGQKMEDVILSSVNEPGVVADGHRMLWTQANLLNIRDVHKLLPKNTTHKLYNLIIDKSTSDSIACCSDVDYDPAMLNSSSAMPVTTSASQSDINLNQVGTTRKIMPVNLLVLHMAAITAADGCWLVLSYSESRFSFLEKADPFHPQPKDLCHGEPNPADFWSLERKQEINRVEIAESSGAHGHIVYRPVTVDWLYLLRRNDRLLTLNLTD